MIDYSNLMQVSGNAQRGNQQPGNAFSSLGNLFGAGGSMGTGAAPMNLQPGVAAHQPGFNLNGMLGFLGNAFSNPGSGNIDYGGLAGQLPAGSLGQSLAQLAGIFGAARGMPSPKPPAWAQSGYMADPNSGYKPPTMPGWGGPR